MRKTCSAQVTVDYLEAGERSRPTESRGKWRSPLLSWAALNHNPPKSTAVLLHVLFRLAPLIGRLNRCGYLPPKGDYAKRLAHEPRV